MGTGKILVVDDEPDFCEALRKLLNDKGYQVVVALSGEEALLAYRLHNPNLVLLDVMMPGMSGLVTLRELKAIDPNAKVMMLTALHEEELARDAIAVGAVDYVTKPINPDHFELALMTYIALPGGNKDE